jgi:hypothetical protein
MGRVEIPYPSLTIFSHGILLKIPVIVAISE